MKGAVKRDPEDWEFHYALAIATAAEGIDPLPELRSALRLDRREELISTVDHRLPRRASSQAATDCAAGPTRRPVSRVRSAAEELRASANHEADAEQAQSDRHRRQHRVARERQPSGARGWC